MEAAQSRARPQSNPAGQRERWLRDPPEQDDPCAAPERERERERERENRYREVPPSPIVLDEQSVLAG